MEQVGLVMSNIELFAEFARCWLADRHPGLPLKVCPSCDGENFAITLWGIGPDLERIVGRAGLLEVEISDDKLSSQDLLRCLAERLEQAVTDIHEAGCAVVPMEFAVDRVKCFREAEYSRYVGRKSG